MFGCSVLEHLNNMINKVHERALGLIFNNHESNFETLSLNNNDVCKNGCSPLIMGSLLKGRNNTYNVRNFEEFETERKRTVYFGLETISCRSLQLWSLLPEHMKQLNSVNQFKRSVRPCRLCKVYLQNVGFL